MVAKAGGTSNSTAEAVMTSLAWAEKTDLFVASAPGKLRGVDGPLGDKVTDTSLHARAAYVDSGEVPGRLADTVVERYHGILSGTGALASHGAWLDRLPVRFVQAVEHSDDAASMIGERFQAEVYVMLGGFRLLDPGRAPHDLGSSPEAWRAWLSTVFQPGEKHALVGNATLVDGQLRTFSRGGCDTSSGFGAYGIHAARNLNLTDNSAMSADPKLVVGEGRVRSLPHLLYAEGRELGRNGTGLVHPAAMIPLMTGNIPTEIRDTFNAAAPFTTLDNNTARAESRAGRVAALSLMENVVAHRAHRVGMAEAVGQLAAFENALAGRDVPIIDSQGDGVDGHLYFVEAGNADRAAEALESALKGTVVERGKTISLVTLVGYKLGQRLVDNLFTLFLNSGIAGKDWQAQGFPLSTGQHSLRIGVRPQDAKDTLDRIHQVAIEAPRIRI